MIVTTGHFLSTIHKASQVVDILHNVGHLESDATSEPDNLSFGLVVVGLLLSSAQPVHHGEDGPCLSDSPEDGVLINE